MKLKHLQRKCLFERPTGLIGQVDMNTLMRYRIRSRTITPKEKLQLIDEKGKPIIGPVFMRGTFLYAYGKDGIYKKRVEY